MGEASSDRPRGAWPQAEVIETGSITTNIGQHCNGGMCVGGYQEGTGTANTLLDSPVGLAFHHPSNTLFVCDSGNNVIRAMN